MALLIKLKRTNSQLSNLSSVVLSEGEPLYSFADKQFVIGDGSTNVANLPKLFAKTWKGDVIETTYGGTGNNTGYIRTGLKSGVTAGTRSTAEGYNTSSTGTNSHSEGNTTTASAAASHAEGASTIASGQNAHAEGSTTTASGNASHAEGTSNIASGNSAHAEGYTNTASGNYSSVSGSNNIAKNRSQVVFGEYNIQDTSSANTSNKGTYIEIVGNGTAANARSNARTLDWNGNEQISGNLTPMTSNTQRLGSTTNRWSKLYIGNANSYGNSTTPIYWNDGVPTPVTSINVPTTSTAASLTTARQLGVKLDSNTAVTFNGSADQLAIPVSGVLKVANGGTGYNSVDTTPTAGSAKMVTSGGVKTALDGKANTNHTHNYAASSSAGGAANSVANTLTFSTSGNGGGNGTTYNGSAARTISYNSVGAAPTSHTHNYAGSSSAGGAANSAVKLTTARTVQVNLASSVAASFDGTSNISPGVSGTLGVGNGGTGATTFNNKNSVIVANDTAANGVLKTVRSTSGALYSTGTDVKPTFGTLPVAQGGTGKSSWTNKGVLIANSSTTFDQVTPSGANQILMSDSSSVPKWFTPLNSLDSNSLTPPTSSAVYNAMNNIHIENLGPLSSTYIWDTLSTTTYYVTSEISGQVTSSINPSVWKISTWTSCTAINATTLQLSGNPVVYDVPDRQGSITIPANRYCLFELNTTANPYNTTSQVFYTGSSNNTIFITVEYAGGTSQVAIPVVAITINGTTTYYPQGSSEYTYAHMATVFGGTYEYMTLGGGAGSGASYASYKMYGSQAGTIISAGGARQSSVSWQTETGTSTMYTHGIGSNIIHLCRGSLADILLSRRMGVYTGSGSSPITINFGSWVPKLLLIEQNISVDSGSESRCYQTIVDTYNLRNGMNPSMGLMGVTGSNISVVWGNNNCKSIKISYNDPNFGSYFNQSGVSYRYMALA